MGTESQLKMFVTGPAGTGKSTAINVAQKFCFEFCRTLALPWDKNTFLFTAITGCAAALFDGVTLHSAAFLNSKSLPVTPAIIPSNSKHHLTSILSINKNKILVFYPCEKPKSAQLGIFHPPLV